MAAEIISNQGLLLTNHHCGYGQIQAHSSVQNDYLTNGFWAKNLSEELPNKNLEVTFIIRIEDVTKKVLADTQNLNDETLRNAQDKETSLLWYKIPLKKVGKKIAFAHSMRATNISFL